LDIQPGAVQQDHLVALFLITNKENLKSKWECSSVTELLPSMWEALGLILSSTKINE
jgi:hypothetical protein